MQKIITALFFTLAFSVHATPSGAPYSKIRIPVGTHEDLQRIGRLGIAVDEGFIRKNKSIEIFVSGVEQQRLTSAGIFFETIIPDWDAFYRQQRAGEDNFGIVSAAQSRVKHFHLGSMGGFFTLAQAKAEFDSMRLLFPQFISRCDTIGFSCENRPIWAIKLSKNPDLDEGEPRVLYTGLHHAREGIGLMQLVYYMWYLLENYSSDPDVRSIVDHRELFFVPIVNPDGYVYNQTISPNGGGMWRKNRKKNTDGSFGIDLNRNYDYKWGFDNIGSSGVENDETFRGASGFSEPETRAVKKFCIDKKFSLAVNYHSYGNLLIYPWGYSDSETKDSSCFRQLSEDMTAMNGYTFGIGSQTVGYETNGGSDDWMYGDTLQKPGIFSHTAELGTSQDGFWPRTSRIIPLCDENVGADIYLAQTAGQRITIVDASVEQSKSNDSIKIFLSLKNRGRKSVSTTVDILQIESDQVVLIDKSILSVPWQTSKPIVIRALRKEGFANGTKAIIRCLAGSNGEVHRDSVQFRIGIPDLLYADGAESQRGNWISLSNRPQMKWDTTSVSAHSGKYSYSESPAGNYLDNYSSRWTLNKKFLLNGIAAELRFWAKWNIEVDFDSLQVQISSDNGLTWKPLRGRLSKNWLSSPIYFGNRHNWTEEIIDLDPYVNKEIMIRFVFASDPGVNYDGFYLDDISLAIYRPFQNGIAESITSPAAIRLDQNYPNPFNAQTLISFSVPVASEALVKIYDVLGREVARLFDGMAPAGTYKIRWDGTGISGGVYFYSLDVGKNRIIRKLIMVK